MGKASPFFSVVIPTYNSAALIVHSIRAALAQSFRDFEIIVVGDGCTDNTGDILAREFGEEIRWKNLERNSGSQSAPNNEGIRLARGSHIAYLGHDDIWSRHHLELLAQVVHQTDPDFTVSGAVYYGPPGSMFYQFTGIFDDPETARREFFPPSSFAHKRDLTDRIGGWRKPDELRAPVDCEILMRAVSSGCRFASTKTISVHKFAAGHRYLSYRFPCPDEQKNMLRRLDEPAGDARVLSEIVADISNGATVSGVSYPDFECFAPGELYRRNRTNKGLERSPPRLLEKSELFIIDGSPAALDWHPLARHPIHGPFRWSGPNPNPAHFLNVRVPGGVQVRIHIVDFAQNNLADLLKIDINERETDFLCEKNADGSYLISATFSAVVEDGLLLRFRMPTSVPISTEFGTCRAGLALSRVEIAPLRE
jgi:glycosyltransferase involved in cell wall biosynthesis